MKIPDKLPNPPLYEGSLCPKMTEEDWIEYFKCREKYDKPMSDEEKNKIMDEAEALTLKGDCDAAAELTKKIPVIPSVAYQIKCCGGLIALVDFNLYEAKQEYPDEF